MREDLSRKVAIIQMDRAEYPQNPPFNPPEKYPEYPYDKIDATNFVYEAIRDILIQLGLDSENYGTEKWNPLGKIIKPGDNVVIKPNFVSEPRANWIDSECLITHASVIRPIIDYCHIALKEKGSLVVADAPQTDSNFEIIRDITHIQEVLDYVNFRTKPNVDLLDLRIETAEVFNGLVIRNNIINGDPKGYTVVDLNDKSSFCQIEHNMDKLYGADYNFNELRTHHSGGRHEYLISNTILNSNVIINMPKLKTHKKAGITVCLKNIVGINGDKNYLPHYRFGSKDEGGDEFDGKHIWKMIGTEFYKTTFRLLSSLGPTGRKGMIMPRIIYGFLYNRKLTRNTGGSWHGNDTLWRTIVDLNRILFYADGTGKIHDTLQRSYFAVIDGVIAGEGDGPLFPMRKQCGVLIAGFNPFLLDNRASHIMGFNWAKIPHVIRAKELFPDSGININECLSPQFEFAPAPLWESIKLSTKK